MTKVRTRVVKRNYAKTQSSQSCLIIDSYGLINVIDFDDMDYFLKSLQIDSSKALLFEDLINTNLILGFAERIGVMPGIFIDGDVAIINYILSHISADIEPADRDVLIDELKESWLRVYKHPLVQQYIPLGEHRCLDNREQSPHFPAIGALSFFMMNYYSGLVKLFLQCPQASLYLFMQLSEYYYSASKNLAFDRNHFFQLEHLLALLKISENQFAENEDIHIFWSKLQKTDQEETTLWLRRLLGWVLVEFDGVNDFADIGATCLRNLLDRVCPVSENLELEEQMSELLRYLQGPAELKKTLMTSVRFSDLDIEPSELSYLCTQAIDYSIRYYANLHGIILYPKAQVLDGPMFYLASGSDEEQMRLLAYLEDRDNCNRLKPFELYAMARKAKRLELVERVNYEIELKAQRERSSDLVPMFARMTIGRPPLFAGSAGAMAITMRRPTFTPHWARLHDTLRGNGDRQVSTTSPSSSAEPPKMEEVLNLREERGCCIC